MLREPGLGRLLVVAGILGLLTGFATGFEEALWNLNGTTPTS
jgi:hypothetical protein